MCGKILFISSVALLFLAIPHPALADVSAQLKQAETYQNNRQYDQAEAIYQQIITSFPDTNDALEAQKQLVLIYIATDRQQEANASFNKLITDFSKHKDTASAVWQIGQKCIELKKYDKAFELNQYNVEHFPGEICAMWSQVEIVYSYIRGGNDSAADAAFNTLLTAFSSQPTLPKEIYQIARKYEESKRYDKALELHQYNVEHFPADVHAIWSQVEIIYSHLREGDDAVADAEVNNLFTVFSKEPTLSKEIYQVGRKYNELKKYDKALKLHRYNVEHFPADVHAIWSQVEIIKSYIRDGNEPVADTAFNKLLTTFSKQPTLPNEIQQIADAYNSAGKYDKANELYQKSGQIYQSVIDKKPDSNDELWAKVGIAKLNIALGNDAAAEATINNLIADFNDHLGLPEAIFTIGEEYYYKAMADANEDRTDQADANFVKTVSAWDRIITQLPESNSPPVQDAYYFGGYCYGRLGEHKKAIEYWQKIVDNWPDYKYVWHAQFRIAYSYSMLGHSGVIPESEALSKMEETYKKVLENYPDCPLANIALLRLGNLNYGRGQWNEAAKYYELFLEKFPGDKRWNDVLYSLAYAYQKMGQSQTSAELRRAFIEAAGSDASVVSERLERWLENPEGPKK